MDIKEALTQLDPENNDHWTADGAPRVDVVAELVGNPGLKRADITNAAPDFHRSKAGQPTEPEETKEAAESEQPAEGEAQETAETKEGEADANLRNEQGSAEAPETPEAEAVADEGEGDLPEEVAPVPASEPEPVRELTPLEQIEAKIAERSKAMLDAQREVEQAKERADELANEVNALNREADNLRKHDPNHDTAGIRAYIQQQNKNRMKRAEGLQRFVETTGVHPNDVAKAVDPRAPIDQAMAGRKPARGSQRPDMPKRVR